MRKSGVRKGKNGPASHAHRRGSLRLINLRGIGGLFRRTQFGGRRRVEPGRGLRGVSVPAYGHDQYP